MWYLINDLTKREELKETLSSSVSEESGAGGFREASVTSMVETSVVTPRSRLRALVYGEGQLDSLGGRESLLRGGISGRATAQVGRQGVSCSKCYRVGEIAGKIRGLGYDPPAVAGARLMARTKKEAIWARVTGLSGQ